MVELQAPDTDDLELPMKAYKRKQHAKYEEERITQGVTKQELVEKVSVSNTLAKLVEEEGGCGRAG